MLVNFNIKVYNSYMKFLSNIIRCDLYPTQYWDTTNSICSIENIRLRLKDK